MDTCWGVRVFRTGVGHFELDLWHISYIIGGRNPKCSVWIHLEVAEYHTMFIDHCVSFMKIYCLWGHFCHTVTQFMILPNNQLSNSAIQRYLNRWYNPFLTLKKRLNCTKSISTFSLSTQHPYSMIKGKTNSNFPKLQASTLRLYQCLSFQVLLPTCILYM